MKSVRNNLHSPIFIGYSILQKQLTTQVWRNVARNFPGSIWTNVDLWTIGAVEKEIRVRAQS
jgi:hypothetical protein